MNPIWKKAKTSEVQTIHSMLQQKRKINLYCNPNHRLAKDTDCFSSWLDSQKDKKLILETGK